MTNNMHLYVWYTKQNISKKHIVYYIYTVIHLPIGMILLCILHMPTYTYIYIYMRYEKIEGVHLCNLKTINMWKKFAKVCLTYI